MTRLADLVLESATDYAIITTDLGGHITCWSRGAETILGWQPDEVAGKPIDLIFSAKDRAKDIPAVELGNALSKGRRIVPLRSGRRNCSTSLPRNWVTGSRT